MKQKLMVVLLATLAMGATASVAQAQTASCVTPTQTISLQKALVEVQAAKANALKPFDLELAAANVKLTAALSAYNTSVTTQATLTKTVEVSKARVAQLTQMLSTSAGELTAVASATNSLNEQLSATQREYAAVKLNIAGMQEGVARELAQNSSRQTQVSAEVASLQKALAAIPQPNIVPAGSVAQALDNLARVRNHSSQVMQVKDSIIKAELEISRLAAEAQRIRTEGAMSIRPAESRLSFLGAQTTAINTALADMAKLKAALSNRTALMAERTKLEIVINDAIKRSQALSAVMYQQQLAVREYQTIVANIKTRMASVAASYDLRYNDIKKQLSLPACPVPVTLAK